MARWGKCDTSQLKKFRDKLERLEKVEFNRVAVSTAQELGSRLMRSAKNRTPVGNSVSHMEDMKDDKDKVLVYERNAIYHKKGDVKQKRVTTHTGGELKRNWKTLSVRKKGRRYSTEVYNPTKYASYVEFGHSQTPGRYVPAIGKRLVRGWAPGKFMLTISEKKLQRDAPGIIEKNVNAALEEAFNGK